MRPQRRSQGFHRPGFENDGLLYTIKIYCMFSCVSTSSSTNIIFRMSCYLCTKHIITPTLLKVLQSTNDYKLNTTTY